MESKHRRRCWCILGTLGQRRKFEILSYFFRLIYGLYRNFEIHKGLAVCYSGYRHGQRPGHLHPTYKQVIEDLLIIEKQWQYIRLYSCDAHSKTVLEVIKDEKISLKVMLGAYIEAEENNINCPWGGSYDLDQLSKNKKRNLQQMDSLIDLANTYPDIIFSLSVGNEACVDWTDHLVSVEAVVSYVRYVKAGAKQPVTFVKIMFHGLTNLSHWPMR